VKPTSSASAAVLVLIVGTALVRVALGCTIGLSVDESYAVVMSRHLAISYYDHPPLLFWIPGAAARLAGGESRIVVRLPFILMFAGTTWNLYRLGARLFGERAGFLGAVTLNLALFFTLSAGGWVLPDGPLLLFSAAAALCLARATLSPDPGPRETRTPAWLGFGLFTGLALLSKYHAAFLLLGAGLFLLTTPGCRFWWKRPQPYVAAAIAVLLFAPVVIWNAQNNWASLRFQGGRAVPVAGYGTPFLDTLAGQAAWMLPWIWVPLLIVLAGGLRSGPRDPARWLLTCLAIGPIGFFTALTAVGSRGLPHWQAPGYFMLFPMLGASLASRLSASGRWTRLWLWCSAAATALVVLVFATHVWTGWLDVRFPGLFVKGDPTRDLIEWRGLPRRLRRWGYPQPGVVVAAATWADAAKVAYALGPQVPVTCVGEDPRGFHYDASAPPSVGKDVLLVVSRRTGGQEAMQRYAPYFEHIEAVGSVPIVRGGRPEIELSVYLGRRLLRPVPASKPL
jgi:4-amino-4-deoxy-L-arabinose transferase-like glycosyltransferase